MGRDFLPEEGQLGKDHEIILTYKLWKNRFGGDSEILGQQVRLDGQSYAVVGVLAAGATDRVQSELYIPLTFRPEQINHDFHWILVMARLKPDATLAQANADMEAVTKHIAEVYPKSNQGWSATVEPLQNDFLSRDTVRALWTLLGAVGFVLLIACANVANLLLARGTTRRKEIAVRSALGATRAQLFYQFLTESVILAGLGGAIGVALAWAFLKLILALMPPFTLPSEADVHLSVPVLFFTLAATMFSGILFGCAPAFQAMGLHLTDALKEGSQGSGVSRSRHRVRHILVVGEFALALTLLAAAGMAVHSFWNLTHEDAGFRTDHILTFSLPMPTERIPQPEQMVTFYRQLLERVNALPGVVSSSVSTGMPVSGVNFGMDFNVVGREVADPTQRPGSRFNMATPAYFSTFGIRITRGRPLAETDTAGGMPVAIINEELARKYLSDVDPLTQRLSVSQIVPGTAKLGPIVNWQVVGVYQNVRTPDPKDGQRPEIIVPFAQSPWPGVSVAVRTNGDPASMTNSIAAVVRSLDSDLPMADVKTMGRLLDESMGGDRFGAVLFGIFAAIALVLAAFGIYGVTSFAVAQRTHEIGLRMALGAGSRQVLKMILKEGLVLGAIGVVIGGAGAWAVGRVMQRLLYGIGSVDYGAFSVVAAILMGCAFLACYIPASRATLVDPLRALRDE